MKLIRIFVGENAKGPDGLYSIKYDNKSHSEYTSVMQSWHNRDFLYSFFRSNISDLENGFWGDITLAEAICNTVSDAKIFEETLSTYCRSSTYELQYIFPAIT